MMDDENRTWEESKTDLNLPVIGTEYDLFLGFGQATQERHSEFVYLGFKPMADVCIRERRPEGHLFGELDHKGRLMLYSARTDKPFLRENWATDRKGNPYTPVGFEVKEVEDSIIPHKLKRVISPYLRIRKSIIRERLRSYAT